jgi:mRNA-degrading endonuclease RelE of RelBE toxin-antitoxin system
MEISYSEKAVKQLKLICKGDRKSGKMIIERIEHYAANPSDKFDIKILKGAYGEFKRLRVGNYRIIFEDTEEAMQIYEIIHRQEAYR